MATMLNYDNVLICEIGNGTTPFTDLDELHAFLTNQSGIEASYIGLENMCHVHFVIHFKCDCGKCKEKLIKYLREQFYILTGFKKKKRGGMNNIVIKESQFNLEKYKELNQEEQKYYQYIYTFKEYDPELNTHRRNNISRELCEQYHNDYWKIYRKIIKTNSLKKKQASAKTKCLRDSLKDFFQKHRKRKTGADGKITDLHMDASDYVKIVASWYQEMGIEHSLTDCERRVLMLMAMDKPEQHEYILLQNLSNKFLY